MAFCSKFSQYPYISEGDYGLCVVKYGNGPDNKGDYDWFWVRDYVKGMYSGGEDSEDEFKKILFKFVKLNTLYFDEIIDDMDDFIVSHPFKDLKTDEDVCEWVKLYSSIFTGKDIEQKYSAKAIDKITSEIKELEERKKELTSKIQSLKVKKMKMINQSQK